MLFSGFVFFFSFCFFFFWGGSKNCAQKLNLYLPAIYLAQVHSSNYNKPKAHRIIYLNKPNEEITHSKQMTYSSHYCSRKGDMRGINVQVLTEVYLFISHLHGDHELQQELSLSCPVHYFRTKPPFCVMSWPLPLLDFGGCSFLVSIYSDII